MPATTAERKIYDIKRGTITTLGGGVAVNLDIPIPSNSAVGFKITVIARGSVVTAASAFWYKAGVIHDTGGSTVIEGQQDIVTPIIGAILAGSNVVASISGTNLRIAFNDNNADAMKFQYIVELQIN